MALQTRGHRKCYPRGTGHIEQLQYEIYEWTLILCEIQKQEIDKIMFPVCRQNSDHTLH